jgi:hypothetical protein
VRKIKYYKLQILQINKKISKNLEFIINIKLDILFNRHIPIITAWTSFNCNMLKS